jgi:hypothetical protein
MSQTKKEQANMASPFPHWIQMVLDRPEKMPLDLSVLALASIGDFHAPRESHPLQLRVHLGGSSSMRLTKSYDRFTGSLK